MDGAPVRVVEVECAGDGSRRPVGFSPPGKWELVLVRRGSFRFRSPGADGLADATTALLVGPGREFEISHPAPGGDSDTFIILDEVTVAAVAGPDRRLPCLVPTAPAGERLHRRLVQLAGRGAGEEVEEVAVRLIAGLLDGAPPGSPRRPRLPRSVRSQDLIEHARSVVSADPDLSAVQVAQRVSCSPQHLSRLFVRHTGAGIAAYRRAVRTAHALGLIGDNRAGLADVAAACGFADAAHLSHVVRDRFGTTPSALRAALTAGSLPAPDAGPTAGSSR